MSRVYAALLGFSLLLLVPTLCLLVIGWRQTAADGRRQLADQRDHHESAADSARVLAGSALAAIELAESRRALESYFLAMDTVAHSPTVSSPNRDTSGLWPTYVRGRFRLTREGEIRGADLLPVPELAAGLDSLLLAARAVAVDVEVSAGVSLRQILADERAVVSRASSLREKIACESLRGWFAKPGFAGEGFIPECESGEVVVHVGSVRFLTGESPSGSYALVVRPAFLADYGTFLVGSLVDLDRLYEVVLSEQRLGRAKILVTGTRTSLLPAGWQESVSKPIDERRLPGYRVLVITPDPDPVREAVTSSQVRFAALSVVMASVLVACLWAMARFVIGTLRTAEERALFTSSITHELRTPLTAIKMYAEMAADPAMADPSRSAVHLQRIVDESARLERLIANVLTTAASDRGEIDLELKLADLGSHLRAYVDRSRDSLARKDFEISLNIQGVVPQVLFDPGAMDQILSNLVENAVRYGAGTKNQIEVSLVADGEGAILRVQDQGSGIERGDVHKIFESFTRGRGARRHSGSGIGLGLAIVRSLVTRHGGEVTASNLEAGGARFEIRLPPPATSARRR